MREVGQAAEPQTGGKGEPRVFGIKVLGQPATKLLLTERQLGWIEAEEIVRIHADDDYVVVHARDKEYMAYIRLASLLKQLDSRQFIQVHRSHVINLAHVRRWWHHEGRRVGFAMSDGSIILGGRRRRKETLLALGEQPPEGVFAG